MCYRLVAKRERLWKKGGKPASEIESRSGAKGAGKMIGTMTVTWNHLFMNRRIVLIEAAMNGKSNLKNNFASVAVVWIFLSSHINQTSRFYNTKNEWNESVMTVSDIILDTNGLKTCDTVLELLSKILFIYIVMPDKIKEVMLSWLLH